jgi:hypothetical protein
MKHNRVVVHGFMSAERRFKDSDVMLDLAWKFNALLASHFAVAFRSSNVTLKVCASSRW